MVARSHQRRIKPLRKKSVPNSIGLGDYRVHVDGISGGSQDRRLGHMVKLLLHPLVEGGIG